MKRLFQILQLILFVAPTMGGGACGGSRIQTPYKVPALTLQEQRWETAHQQERNGKMVKALHGYKELCEDKESYMRACYDVCRLLFDEQQHEQARKCAVQYIEHYPESTFASISGKKLASSYAQNDEHAVGVSVLMTLSRQCQKSDVWDSLIFEVARLYRSLDNVGEEEKALRRIVSKGRWGSQLWDNSLWRVIQIQQEKGDVKAEEKYILKMLNAQEKSVLIASYNSPYYDDALYRLGQLYQQQGMFGDAYDAYSKLADWETSRFADDALFSCASVAHQQGHIERACTHLMQLIDEMSASSSYKKAVEHFHQWRCDKQ